MYVASYAMTKIVGKLKLMFAMYTVVARYVHID